MDHMNIRDFWRIKVQFSGQKLSNDHSKISVWPPLTTQSKATGARWVVSCPSAVQLGVALVLFYLLHSAHGSPTSCIEFTKGAVEHIIQVGGREFSCFHVRGGPKNDHSCSGGSEGCWSCKDLRTSTPRTSFFLHSTSHHGRWQETPGRTMAFKDGLSDQHRMRKLGPIDNTSAEEERWTEEVVHDRVQPQDWVIFEVAAVCSREPNSSVALSTSFFGLMLNRKSLQNLERPSSPWRCNSTAVARIPTSSGETTSSPTRDPTDSSGNGSTFTFNFVVKAHKTIMVKAPSSSWLLQFLELVDERLQIQAMESCNGVAGKRIPARRSLLADSWKPVVIADSIVAVIALVLAALSCWVWQRTSVKSDTDDVLSRMFPSNLGGSDGTSSSGRGSPRNRLLVTGSDAAESMGRWSQVPDGPGRWEWVPEAESLGRGPEVEKEESGRGPEVDIEGPDREAEVDLEGPGRGPEVEIEGPGRGPKLEIEGPGRGPEVVELPASGIRRRVVEEGSGRGSSVGSPEGSSERAGDDRATATAQRSWQTALYRVEPFCFEGLAAATRDFDESNKLGEGSFGSVYCGLLFDGRVVAIKRADRSNTVKMVDKQSAFKAELDVMSRLHHKHLVNLVGYCDDCDEMMLVYEYMPNGTLADHLHNRRFQSRALSTWKVRVRVALQAARGIEYLHTYAEPPVIHRDIKSSNILLDAKGSVRVSDFGLCLIFPPSSEDQEEEDGEEVRLVSTKAAGTMGYMDPEYYRHRHLTTKSDVYSFGVVILELLTGKRAIHRRNNSHASLVDYAVPAIEADELARIVDPRVRAPTGHEFAAMKVMAEIGSQAVRLRGKDRPGMTEIVRRLEQAVTLCRSRHAPLPIFGAQIGSFTDLSYSRGSLPSRPSEDRHGDAFQLDPAAAALLDKFLGLVEEDEEEGEGNTGTDVTQVGSVDVAQVRSLPTTQASILGEFPPDNPHGDIPTIHSDDGGFEQDKSDVNYLELYRNAHDELLGCPLTRATCSAAGSNIGVDTIFSLSFAAAAKCAIYHSGGHSSGPLSGIPSSRRKRTSDHRETLLQELRENWQQSRPSKSLKLGGSVKLGGSGWFGSLARDGSFYSCEGGSAAAASTTEIRTDYCSGMVVDDPLLHQRTAIMVGFSNFSDLGPPEEFNRTPPGPALSPPPGRSSPEQQEHMHKSLEQGEYGTGAEAVGKEQGEEFKRSTENYIGDVDIEEFLDEYSDEHAGTTSYAGFSNFSVLHDLDELMKALHSLQEEQDDGALKEQLHLQQQQQQQQPGMR